MHRNSTEEERALVLEIYEERTKTASARNRHKPHLMNSRTCIWKMSRQNFQYWSPVSTTLRLSSDFIWAGTVCRYRPFGHPRYMRGHPYINHKRPLQRLRSNCLVRSKHHSCHTLNEYLAPHQNAIHGTHQVSHRWVERSPSSRLRCSTSESGSVLPNGARIPGRSARCSKTQEGLSPIWKKKEI